jgi:hypothetical protein
LTVGSVRDHCKKKTRGGAIFSPRSTAARASPRVDAGGRRHAPALTRASTIMRARRELARAAGACASAQFSLALHPRVGKLLLQILLMGGENLTVTRRRE